MADYPIAGADGMEKHDQGLRGLCRRAYQRAVASISENAGYAERKGGALSMIDCLAAELSGTWQDAQNWRCLLKVRGEEEPMAETIARLTRENDALRNVVSLSLTPRHMRAFAQYLTQHGDLDSNGVCLTAILLQTKADELDQALSTLDAKEARDA